MSLVITRRLEVTRVYEHDYSEKQINNVPFPYIFP